MSTLNNVELVMLRLPKCDETPINRVADLLEMHGFSRDRAETIPSTTAFRRAVAKMRDGAENLAAYCWTAKADKVLRGQLDSITETPNGIVRERLCAWHLAESGPETDYGVEELMSHYDAALSHYTRADIGAIVRRVIDTDGLGAYNPKDEDGCVKGVYFVPVRPDAQDFLTRLEAFSSSVGLRLLRYSIPDTDAQKQEIAGAIASSLWVDLHDQIESIKQYSSDTREGILDNRAAMLDAAESNAERMRDWLGTNIGRIRTALANARTELDAARQRIIDAQAAIHVPTGGRRIVMSA